MTDTDTTTRNIGHVGLAGLFALSVLAYAYGYTDVFGVLVASIVVPFHMLLLEVMYRVERMKQEIGSVIDQ